MPTTTADLPLSTKPNFLSGQNKNSFAYPTLKDRVPIIICKVIDLLHRQRRQLEPNFEDCGLKAVIERMAELRYELVTNKSFTPLSDGRSDENVWNDYLQQIAKQENEIPKWFNTRWLYAECYAYRRLWQCLADSAVLKDFDYFKSQKQDAFFGSISAIRVLARRIHDLVQVDINSDDQTKIRHDFLALLEMSLWGNKCDLSISAGSAQTFSSDPLEQVLQLRSKLLIDQSEQVWDFIANDESDAKIVDIVMDNAGFELFADLCLADFLTTSGIARKIRLHIKNIPWFVSDTTPADLDWLIGQLINGPDNPVSGDGKSDVYQSTENDGVLSKLGVRWKGFLTSGTWTTHLDPFWTYPHDFSLMKSADPELYSRLSESSLIIFKGDLNYRKLVGDLNWKSTDSFETALQGFHPSPLVALRTLKADVVTGLAAGQAEEVSKADPKWMVNGEWGVIQFCPRRE